MQEDFAQRDLLALIEEVARERCPGKGVKVSDSVWRTF
jgi:hypothetical protein